MTSKAKNQPIKQYHQTIKDASFFTQFKKQVRGQKIISVDRRAKNILINLSSGQTILIHMKMTGHLLYGTYARAGKDAWIPAKSEKNEALHDPFNRFLHFVVSFTNGRHLVLSDARKFAKVMLLLENTVHFQDLGPEPLGKSFDLKKFKECLLKKPASRIKQVLMDQSVISGIGNIYSDEMLWSAGIHPLSRVRDIPLKELGKLFVSMKKVLEKGLDFGGDSTSDYRQIDGRPGKFNHAHNVYRLQGTCCKKPGCKGAILRIVIGSRSAHFCPVHQKRFGS